MQTLQRTHNRSMAPVALDYDLVTGSEMRKRRYNAQIAVSGH
jgi:hypothetical protein